ncbi:MAG: SIR2 family protein [Bacteroidales bacterium]|jgi:hypothetical protein|nr:SIR2 family protein [Bacteroidales bacterium]
MKYGKVNKMAKLIDVCKGEEHITALQKAIQSSNINFLFGSGCSSPAIKTLGNIESDIEAKEKSGDLDAALKLLKNFLVPFFDSMIRIKTKALNDNDNKVLGNYSDFIKLISQILYERKSSILHKQVTIFTTNYDLYFELAFQSHRETLVVFDGFQKYSTFDNESPFSTTEYFNTIFNNGLIYNYQVEVPSMNLIKLHGSLNWKIKDGKIVNSIAYINSLDSKAKSTTNKDIKDFVDAFTLVLPQKNKFKETIINQTYYDQLRIFSNELDKENTMLIAHGFSFADEHIFEIVKRALRNPTLLLIVFCYDLTTKTNMKEKFEIYNNVHIFYRENEKLNFPGMTEILNKILPLYLQKSPGGKTV